MTRRVLFVAAGLAGLAALFLIEERMRGSLALSAWQREMRARGEKIDIQELAPSWPTNAAVRIVSASEARGLLAAARAPATIPTAMQMVAPGKARLLSAAGRWIDSDGRTNGWRDLASEFESLRGPLSELRRMLTNRALFIRLDLEEVFDEEDFEMILPHLAPAKSAIQALNADTVHALHEGRLDEAWENLMAATYLLDLLEDEPLLISQLVRIAGAAIIQGGVWEALETEGWTDAQLEALQARWEKQEFMAPMGRALEGWRAQVALAYDPKRYSVWELVELIDGPTLDLFGASSASAPQGELDQLFQPVIEFGGWCRGMMHLVCWRFAWAKQDLLFHHREMQKQIETVRRAARDRRWKAKAAVPSDQDLHPYARSGLFGKMMNRYNRIRFWVAPATLMPSDILLDLPDEAAPMDVMREQIVAAIALKRHRLRHGRLPPTLEALVPEFLTSVPHDWFADAPMRYRPVAGGAYELYSVSSDGVDDGGDGRDSQGDVCGWEFGRDLLWPCLASPEEVAAAESKWMKAGGIKRITIIRPRRVGSAGSGSK
ncbi:MAG TPA: hypothetical protein PKW83_15705 [Verrucomicrobiota bacterium]|nr:hypothetical protein [Verrucomicrobiota bacterium]HPV12097.1 hypothetical protein [Verrucomicrobiota bacterium]HQI34282.1 hypothetical protein [Verrucomicrobiota bacterium]